VTRRRGLTAVLALVAASAIAPSYVVARPPVPPGFFGVGPQDGLRPGDYQRMRGVVGTLRVPVFWFKCEPRRGEFDFEDLDQVVGRAADAGIKVLPFVYGSPPWIAKDPARPPLAGQDRSAWALFLRTLVRRYGPRGEFWDGRRMRLPIRRWQLWNEPNFSIFWGPRPSPKGYARLLAAGARAVRAEDPHARIVLAGLAPVEHEPPPWVFLRRLYRVPHFARSFDIVGLHPYSYSLGSLIYQVEQTRAVMAAAGDRRTPLEVTELGVASAGNRLSPMVMGPGGQAAYLRGAYGLLLSKRRAWRVSGVDWFTWRDTSSEDPFCVFCQHAGLFELSDRPKPAWRAFRAVARFAVR
jgi:polysaccharide biosynthesis protein PslG